MGEGSGLRPPSVPNPIPTQPRGQGKTCALGNPNSSIGKPKSTTYSRNCFLRKPRKIQPDPGASKNPEENERLSIHSFAIRGRVGLQSGAVSE